MNIQINIGIRKIHDVVVARYAVFGLLLYSIRLKTLHSHEIFRLT